MAAIGAGGQAASNIQAAAASGENIVALCDVDDKNAARIFTQYPRLPKFRDFRQMLDKEGKNIDAVTVAIPDHMHATAAMWCMERGKHVYVQKPLVRTVFEARQLKLAAAKYGVATQMGNQGYSNEGTRQCAEIVWNGDIGNVTEVHSWTNRPIWPQGLTEIPKPDPVPETLSWDLWLGIAEKPPVYHWRRGLPDRSGYTSTSRSTGAASTISAAAPWATWRAIFWARRTWRCAFGTQTSERGVRQPGRQARSCSRRNPPSGSTSGP